MNLKNIFKSVLIVIISLITTNNTIQAQCFQIESILVDACGSQEGLNEMVRFKVGNAPLNTNSLTISWPNNPWQGLIKNNVTASKVATLNADILDAGGCGQLIEPVVGIIPANATAIIVTSHNMDTALNSFGAITENIYIIFQNNPTTASGHFANSGAGNRTLNMSFGSCSDTATYNRELLIDESGNTTSGDGATVLFSENGTATYVNYGCTAPVPPFTVDAGNSQSGCTGATISLTATGLGYQSVSWSAPTGTFSAPNSLATNYTIGNNVGTVVLTITATDSCGSSISDTVTITVTSGVIPNFPLQMTLCGQNPAPILQTVSPNGISGTWFPTTINISQSGSYVFTPNAGQCAQNVTLEVAIGQFDFDIEKICSDGDLNLQPIFASELQNENYQWRDETGNTISRDAILNVSDLFQSTSFTEQFPLIYYLTITTAEGCSAERSFTVNSIFCSIQKGISPNNDDANDTFDLTGLGVTELQIFNRYGIKVYSRKNYVNEWNGVTDKGDELPDGTYYYVISTKNNESLTGWIYVIRSQD